MNRVAIISLGCPKNQIDAETMAGLLKKGGYQFTSYPETADIILVNTCSFITEARQESIDEILAMAKHKQNGRCRQLLVTGCLAQMHHQELAEEIPEIDGFLGTGSVDRVLELLQGGKSIISSPEDYDGRAEKLRLYSTLPYGYLKIAEGCDNHCSYCVIPKLRGPLRSKALQQIIDEAELLVATGRREIVLIAQDTTQYGRDWGDKSQLPELLTRLGDINELRWLRLLYCYPEHITETLINAFVSSRKLCRYLDIPLQHSHPDILDSMGRKSGGIRELIEKLRYYLPGIAIRSTFIVGYPGETHAHFQHLMDFVRWAQFDHLGAFLYSQERGTRAAAMSNQVPRAIKLQRYHQLMTLQQEIVGERNQKLLGKDFTVHIDSIRNGFAIGRSYREAPEIDNHIIIPATTCKPGDFIHIRCTGFKGYELLGEIIE